MVIGEAEFFFIEIKMKLMFLKWLLKNNYCCWSYFKTRNTFYGTRHLSHCCVLFCIKTFFL